MHMRCRVALLASEQRGVVERAVAQEDGFGLDFTSVDSGLTSKLKPVTRPWQIEHRAGPDS